MKGALPFATVVTWRPLNFQSAIRQALQRLLAERVTIAPIAMILRRLGSEPAAAQPNRSYPHDKELPRRGDFPFAYRVTASLNDIAVLTTTIRQGFLVLPVPARDQLPREHSAA